jgi:hypothetical protein
MVLTCAINHNGSHLKVELQTIHHSSFTNHHSPFTIYHSPFTIHTQDAAFISFYLRKPAVLGYNLMTALSQNILDQKEEQYEIF